MTDQNSKIIKTNSMKAVVLDKLSIWMSLVDTNLHLFNKIYFDDVLMI